MLFNSYIFIFLFLPLVLLGWYGLNRIKKYHAAQFFLCCMSLWFYAYFNLNYLAIIIVSILVNYLLSLSLHKFGKYPKLILAIGLLFNIGVFFYFKYFDFFLENVNAIFKTNYQLLGIVLPLGISFFTFQQLSYVIDRCKGRAEHCGLLDYAAFVTFFPQLIAGPIVLHEEMLPQFRDYERRRFDANSFSRGILLFSIGMAKKVLLADVLALPVGYGFAQTFSIDTVSTIYVILCYTFEIYFDFSGYCDMAMGLAAMFNMTLPVNFNSPYKAVTVKQLWQKWHITLSRFFTTYVYIPLGGSRKGKVRTAINTIVVFALSGLWHGANWTFVTWGMIHGLLVAFENLNLIGVKGQPEKKPSKIHVPVWMGWTFTFFAFVISLFFFRSESMAGAFKMFQNLFDLSWNGSLFMVAGQFSISEIYIIQEAIGIAIPAYAGYANILLLTLFMGFCFFLISRKNSMEIADSSKYGVKTAVLSAVLLMWCMISLSQVSTFLYFNF